MAIKIKQVIPITEDFLMDDVTRSYIGKYLDRDTIVELSQIKQGAASIESEYDEAISAPHVIELCKKAEADGADGIFVDCFGDPGVRAARECVDIPVFGGFEPAVHLALGLSDKIGIVTVLDNVIPMIEGNIAKAHLGGRVVSVRSVDMPVLELEDSSKLSEKLIIESKAAIEEDHVGAVVLGCTGMVDVAENVRAALYDMGYDVPVIEAAQAALNMVELYAKMGLKQSRITYMKPREK